MGWLRTILVGGFYTFIVAGAVAFLAAAQMRAEGGARFDQWRLNYEAQQTRVELADALTKDTAAAMRTARGNEARAMLCLIMYPEGRLNPEYHPLVADVRGGKIDDLSGEQWCVAAGLMELRAERDWWGHEVSLVMADAERLSAEQVSLNKALTEMERERAAFLSLVRFADSNTLARAAVVTPYDLLLMLLVIAMGGLGGLARLVRDYGAAAAPNPSLKDYMIIPLIGGAVAVGGFVAARSGLLLLSAGGQETALSPYTISLVGIISGLLAPEVIDRIAAKGRDVLRGQVDRAGKPP